MAENGKGGILNKIALNQLGLLRNSTFQQNITKLRINQLPTLGIHESSRHDLIYWESYRSGPEEFNDDGNLLFVGRDEHGIEICDIRDVSRKCNLSIRSSSSAFEKEPALRDSSLIVNKMKLLSDQVTLIATGIEGEMRMSRLSQGRSGKTERTAVLMDAALAFKVPRKNYIRGIFGN
ncbi:DDB1-and CUL4-associated factor 4-like protein 1 [Trichonephila clavipes]|nr:DDB1-and CUL4-associated factor 4-like protein 1 [Trichonephila clavipes]